MPKGSVLGRLLFLIYVNDIPSTITYCTPYLFADDTKFLEAVSHYTVSTHFLHDSDSLADWCLTWKLSPNSSKCASVHSSFSSSCSSTYNINGHPIKSVTQYKDIGIIVQNNLTWSEHTHHIRAKAYQSLYLIRHSIPSSTPDLKLCLYLSLVHSKLSYYSQLWRPNLINDIICLENVQRRSTKFVLNDYTSDYKSRLTILHLYPLMYWLDCQDFMLRIKCFKDPPDNFDINSHISFVTSCTRACSSAKLRHNFYHFSSTSHFHFNRVVHLQNSLPSIDLTKSYTTIRSQISDFCGITLMTTSTLFLHAHSIYMPMFFLFSITSSLKAILCTTFSYTNHIRLHQ